MCIFRGAVWSGPPVLAPSAGMQAGMITRRVPRRGGGCKNTQLRLPELSSLRQKTPPQPGAASGLTLNNDRFP